MRTCWLGEDILKSIRVQIALLAIVPLLAFVVLGAMTIEEAYRESRHASEIQPIADMAHGIEGFLEEMTRDVEERRRATRKQEMGQQVTLVTEGGKVFETRLMNSSEGGIGVMYFEGARVGQLVIYEDFSGRKFPMEIKWVSDDTVGLQYRAEAGSMAAAA
ncbi:ATP-dependent DNA ligase [Roseibium aggregatum IAM 12614]|uniref:ATP-dependent DNA ligase n=2 Tax=Roseibium aggregatum TaxID=187304 RepID=A0NRB7_ROSAI|nr:ATP-dependent DNA ligase [Roseibium aggregatum IAM 12614]